MQFSTPGGGVTMSKMSKKKPSMRAEKRPPHPAVVAVEAALRAPRPPPASSATAAAFPAASPTRLGRRGWHELLDALGLSAPRLRERFRGRRRVRLRRDPPARRRGAGRDGEDRAVLDAADFCGALVVYVAGMVASRPARRRAASAAVDVVLGGASSPREPAAPGSKVKPTSADSLTRIDFTEALCWLALLKPLPGKGALLHGTWEAGA
ncbi:hypothetical protein JL721_10040 [Aureococcus anophagefferens]|nr:hypothetical protein JL721_10040 [Aureococcus anophagefferens]